MFSESSEQSRTDFFKRLLICFEEVLPLSTNTNFKFRFFFFLDQNSDKEHNKAGTRSRRSNPEMFSPVLSRLAEEATSY